MIYYIFSLQSTTEIHIQIFNIYISFYSYHPIISSNAANFECICMTSGSFSKLYS